MNTYNQSFILNCGYGKGLSVLEVIKGFKKFTKKKIKVNFKKRRQVDMIKIIADISKLKKILKWKPKYNKLDEMVKSSLDWENKIN